MLQRIQWIVGLLLCWLTLWLSSPPGVVAAPSEPEFRLEEILSLKLPAGVDPLGGTILPDGAVMVWSADRLFEIGAARDVIRPICVNRQLAPRAVAAHAASHQIVIYDSLSHSVLELGRELKCSSQVLGQATSAAAVVIPADGNWLEFRRRAHGQLSMRSVTGAKREWLAVSLPPAFVGRLGSPSDYEYMSDQRGAVLVTESEFPFRTFRISASGEIGLLADPLRGEGPRGRAMLLDGWRSLRVIPLDRAYLQIVADLRSDRREFVLVDHAGQPIRKSTVDVAMGMLDVDLRRGMLLALRNVGVREVVFYRWHWGRADQRSHGADQ